MNINVNGHNIFIIIGICFLSSFVLIGLIRKLSLYFGIIDSNKKLQAIHKGEMPLMGGVGIFLSFLLGYILFAPQNTLMISVLISSFLILITGMLEDFGKKEEKSIPPIVRFIIQFLIGFIIVYYGNLVMEKVNIFGYTILFKGASEIVTIIFIVAIINAMNFIDGIDGLCAGVSSIYFLTVACLGIVLNKFGGLDIILSLIMSGATLGYLYWNFPPSRVYQGDTGATFIGLMISIICIIGFKTLTLTSLFIPLLVLALPIFDTLLAIIRRLLKGENPMKADKKHIHHQLLKLKTSQRKTMIIVYLINILFSVLSVFYAVGKNTAIIAGYVILIFILIFLILKTDIIFERNNKEFQEKEDNK